LEMTKRRRYQRKILRSKRNSTRRLRQKRCSHAYAVRNGGLMSSP
jgi:hypothetical protein